MIPDSKRTIVFDVDDTICFTPNRDYSKSYPDDEMVEGMRTLKESGWHIILMTARGMGRSNGDINSVREQVMNEIESFCETYDVPYDEIIIGKPFASYYVDDKALTPEVFRSRVSAIVREGSKPVELWG